MKKLLTFIILFFFSFALVSCDGDHKITYVDTNGETKTVELKATEDPEIVKAAMLFVEQSKQPEEMLKLELDGKVENINLNDLDLFLIKGDLVTDNINVEANLNCEMKAAVYPYDDKTNYPDKGSFSTSVYYTLNDRYTYVDFSIKNVTTSFSQKIKLDSLIPNPNIPNIETNLDLNKVLEELYSMPSLKISIDKVSRKTFDLKISYNIKDLLEKQGVTNSDLSGEISIVFTHAFKSGRLENLKVSATNLAMPSVKIYKLNIDFNIKASYGKFPIKVLTESEKDIFIRA